MNEAPATSLDRLHDLVVPPPAPFWPPAPGVALVLALLALLLLAVLLRQFIRWQRNRYRREALSALAKIETSASSAGAAAGTALAVSELLKRAALTAYHRPDVAALTGDSWFAFLDQTGGTRFSGELGERFDALVYTTSAGESGESGESGGNQAAGLPAELFSEARRWLRNHRP